MKKSMTIGTIVILIIVAIAIILSLSLFIKFKSIYTSQQIEKTCISSVEANTLPGILANGENFVRYVKCPPINLSVKTRDEAIEKIAEKMLSCWSMWGSGKKLFTGKYSLCAICYTIDFENPIQINANEIASALSEKFFVDGKSYAEKMSYVGAGPVVNNVSDKGSYAIMYFYSQIQEKEWWNAALGSPLWNGVIFIPGIGWTARISIWGVGKAVSWFTTQFGIGVAEPHYSQILFGSLDQASDFSSKVNCLAPYGE